MICVPISGFLTVVSGRKHTDHAPYRQSFQHFSVGKQKKEIERVSVLFRIKIHAFLLECKDLSVKQVVVSLKFELSRWLSIAKKIQKN